MATKSLGTLTLDLIAKIGGFEKGMDQAARVSEKRMKQIQATASKVGAGIALGLTAAVSGLAALVKQQINVADNFSLLAQKTGISSEALSQLDYAAKQTGVDELGDALIKFNKTISEAADGAKGQAAAFDAIGVSVKDAQGNLRLTEQVLADVAEQFSKYADNADKTRLAQELFGKSGAALIPFLNQGAAGIARLREEADKLGLTISTDTANAANDFNDSIDRLQASVVGVGRRLATDLTPKMREFADFMSDANTIANLSKFGQAIAAGIETAIKAITALTHQVSTFYGFITSSTPTELIDVLDEIARVEKELESRKGASFFDRFNESAETVEELNQALEELIAKRDRLFEQQRKDLQSPAIPGLPTKPAIQADFSPTIEGAKQAAKEVSELTRQFDIQQEAIAEINAAWETNQGIVNDRMAEAKRIFDETRTPAERYVQTLEHLNELLERGDISLDTYNRAVAQAQEGLRDLSGTTEEVTDEMSEFAEEAARNMQDAFADFLFDPFDKGLKGMLDSFEETLRRMAANQAAAQILGSFGGAGGGSGGGFDWGGLLGSAASFFGSMFGGSTAGTGAVTSNTGGIPLGKMALATPGDTFIPKAFSQMDSMGAMGKAATNINIPVTINAPQGTISQTTRTQIAAQVAREVSRANSRNN